MEENRDYQLEQITKLAETIKILPVKLQEALFWAVENYEVLQEMGKQSELTLEEIQKFKADALAEKSYAEFLLLQITECVKKSKENEEL